MTKALVIFSGGQDSTTCLYWAIKNYDKVEAISFYYGQRHEVEIGCARNICHKERIPHKLVDVSFLANLVDSALTSTGDLNLKNAKGLPDSFVPNRNALFITLAHAYAQKINAGILVTGVCETDFSGYPDCRHNFIQSLGMNLNAGSMSNIQIETPLMWLNKAQTFDLADKLGHLRDVILLSHTCYKGDRSTFNIWGHGCGECPACILRRDGYEKYLKEKN